MTEQPEPELPMSGSDFLEHLSAQHPDLPDLALKSPSEIVGYIKGRYLKPNWPHWRNMAEVSLQQVVWLSLNIEPWKEEADVNEAIEGISRRPAPMMRRYSLYLVDALREEYEPRMAQCLAAIKAKALPARWLNNIHTDLAHDLTLRWYVSLERFRQWGESLRHPYPFPDEFPQATPLDSSIREGLSERADDPSNAGNGKSVTVNTADEYFRQSNAELAAQVSKFADETGYAALVTSVDAKDLHLNLAPDWPHWANMAYVSVSDAACLSLGISPEARLPQINLSEVHEFALAFSSAPPMRAVLGISALERAQRLIQQREEQAMSAIEAGRLSVRGPQHLPQALGLVPSPALVSLPAYRRWAGTLPQPYVFPEGFPPAKPHTEPAMYSSAQPEAPAMDDEKPLREPERGNLLAIIHALSVITKLPERGAASSIERQLEQLGYKAPKERTIRDVLNEARKIKD